jgi:hypothetical protein
MSPLLILDLAFCHIVPYVFQIDSLYVMLAISHSSIVSFPDHHVPPFADLIADPASYVYLINPSFCSLPLKAPNASLIFSFFIATIIIIYEKV